MRNLLDQRDKPISCKSLAPLLLSTSRVCFEEWASMPRDMIMLDSCIAITKPWVFMLMEAQTGNVSQDSILQTYSQEPALLVPPSLYNESMKSFSFGPLSVEVSAVFRKLKSKHGAVLLGISFLFDFDCFSKPILQRAITVTIGGKSELKKLYYLT